MERILLAVDGSEHSNRAAALAGELAHCTQATVFVVHVVPRHLFIAPDDAIEEYTHIEHFYLSQRELLEAAGRNVVAEAAARVRQAGGKVAEEEVVVGSPAREIVDAADRFGCGCIVMGRRGLGDVGALLMGSTSHKVGHMTAKTLITTE